MASILLILIPFLSLLAPSSEFSGSDFLHCMSNASGNIAAAPARIYSPHSAKYHDLLVSASQNRRWLNITAEHPSFIAVPLDEKQVRPVVLCGKRSGLQVRVKSGGHDYEGLSFRSNSPFVMLDLSKLNSVTISVEEKTAWIGTGATLGKLYYEISKRSSTLAFPAGLYQTVGSGGHISGGGLGMLLRKYGLAADNVINARIMDVNGSVFDRPSMGEDVFWAIRGGGGASFGVILAWKLRLVRVPEQVTVFTVRKKLASENLDLLQKWQNSAYKLPEDLSVRVLIFPDTTGETIIRTNYNGLFLGPAEELVLLLRDLFPEFGLEITDCSGIPTNKTCTERPCPRITCYQLSWIRSVLFFMNSDPISRSPRDLLLLNNSTSGFQKATSDFLEAPISNEGFLMIRDMVSKASPGFRPLVILDPFGGKMDQIGETEIPFPHRKGNLYSLQYLANWDDNIEAEKHINWVRELYQKMEPYASRSPRAAYINYKDLGLGKNDRSCSYEHAKVWGVKYFKGNFERLARVKGIVDPENFFQSEQSIPVLL